MTMKGSIALRLESGRGRPSAFGAVNTNSFMPIGLALFGKVGKHHLSRCRRIQTPIKAEFGKDVASSAHPACFAGRGEANGR